VSESKSGKTLLIVVLVLFGGGGLLAWPMVQWFRLEMSARDVISDKNLTRFPDAAKVLSVIPQLKASGVQLGSADLEVTVRLDQRQVGPVIMWYLSVRMKSGSKEFETEKRVETEWQEDQLEILEAAGVVVNRLNPPD
jgi:hypothetical protein